MTYSPRALPEENKSIFHEGNKSHNHDLKADKRLIFTLARAPLGCNNTLKKNASIFIFLLLALVGFPNFSAI